ncbi:hypothetical protein HD554DRAFT_463498 [Boletus coccyginus]|nr:hypothetical protein HD554DRAFT_463498 [Boletus coccyginus]
MRSCTWGNTVPSNPCRRTQNAGTLSTQWHQPPFNAPCGGGGRYNLAVNRTLLAVIGVRSRRSRHILRMVMISTWQCIVLELTPRNATITTDRPDRLKWQMGHIFRRIQARPPTHTSPARCQCQGRPRIWMSSSCSSPPRARAYMTDDASYGSDSACSSQRSRCSSSRALLRGKTVATSLLVQAKSRDLGSRTPCRHPPWRCTHRRHQ